jgi:arabinan endo-1,5-alpha-L-arabinosidase
MMVLLAGCGGAAARTSAAPEPTEAGTDVDAAGRVEADDAGVVAYAHDPSIIAAGGMYYLLSTGGTLGIRRSKDLRSWEDIGSIFTGVPSWINPELGRTVTGLWSPDISFFGGVYRVYYAGSTFGSRHSVIGLATSTTLDASSPVYGWKDEGLVISSNDPGHDDDWNAIDPSFAVDANGEPWLVFGSFWSGIKLRKLDPTTGKLSTADTMLYALAARPNEGDAVEGASIVAHNGYYYLFVSFDYCCRGTKSNYRIMVGRGAAITGPYVDPSGQPMLQGFALELLGTEGRFIGPGGGSVFRDGEQDRYAYHYYDADAEGEPELAVRPIDWGENDWPALGERLVP